MARQRFIKPAFFLHGELYDAEVSSGLPLRVAFAGLWTQADRRGVFRCKPRELKAAVLPYDAVDMGQVINALEAGGFISTYVVDGKRYGHIPTLPDHQTFHKDEKPSSDPGPEAAPCRNGASTVPTQGQHADPTLPYPTLPFPENGGTVRAGKQTPAPNWPADVARALTVVGPVAPGRVGKQLAEFVRTSPVIQEHGLALLVEAAEAYARDATSLEPDRARFLKHPADFFTRAGYWLDRVRPGGGYEQERAHGA